MIEKTAPVKQINSYGIKNKYISKPVLDIRDGGCYDHLNKKVTKRP